MAEPEVIREGTAAAKPLSRAERERLRRDFLTQLGSVEPFQQLFDHLPGVFFFIKDAQSRLICASRPVLQNLGVVHEEEFSATTDYDYFPPYLADKFVRDDQQVMRTRQPLLNHVEIWYNDQHILDWFVTNKLPLFDRRGRVIGVIGTIRNFTGGRGGHLPFAGLNRAVEHIRHNLHEPITVDQLAKLSRISPRQLHRRFCQTFGLGVQQFLAKTRVQVACDALVRSDRSIADIAVACGYCDQSAFTHQFRRHIGLTPHKYRQRYLKAHGADGASA